MTPKKILNESQRFKGDTMTMFSTGSLAQAFLPKHSKTSTPEEIFKNTIIASNNLRKALKDNPRLKANLQAIVLTFARLLEDKDALIAKLRTGLN
jgi:hypothetical protein